MEDVLPKSNQLITANDLRAIERQKRRKKFAVAAAAATAVAAPLAAQVIIQQSNATESKNQTADSAVPEPLRNEYATSRETKGLNDLLGERKNQISDWTK